ncbi:hypothetical protein [Staphylococcus simulans]|uniref:hypothetical protein n=1 Tax=Staphylococcus simulans TaxID=1286 RepID=UPI000D1D975F|nr:hypothetical protein [Staphylococcus simulans]PTJ91673.1 hypothetical protein BU032_04950 [Staphylococcus simulans]UXR50978.1 hypothetical protein MUA28_05395 [Staphylococcus simulans]
MSKIEGMTVNLDLKLKNRNELDELLETIQKDIAALKNDMEKLEDFKFEFNFEQVQNHTSDN